jgi:hypothetical protein
LPGVAAVDVALDPVVGCANAVFGQGFGVGSFSLVQLDASEQQSLQAAGLRTVRVFFGLALGMVLAVHRDKLFGEHSGADPKPKAEKVRRNRPQIERTMRLGPVQEDRDRRDRDVRGDQGVKQHLPPRRFQRAS